MPKKRASTHEGPPPPSQAAAVLAQIALARNTAQSLEKELRKTAPFLDEMAVLLFSRKVFDTAVKEEPDLKTLVSLISLLLKVRQQTLAERKFDLLQAGRAGKGPDGLGRRRDGGYSREQLQQIEEMINLL